MRYGLVVERGAFRPMVPFRMIWHCPRHDQLEDAQGLALIDSGSPWSSLPEAALPGGHVAFDDLDDGGELRIGGWGRPYRMWKAAITVEDVPVRGGWRVYQGNAPDFAIFGWEFFRAFRVDLDFGADPPSFAIEPYGRIPDPVHVVDVPLLAYDDQTFRMAPSLLATRLEPGRPSLAAPGPPAGLLAAPGPPNRAARRRAARQVSR